VVRQLLSESELLVFNLDKCGYASDLTSIEALPQAVATAAAVQQADPDLVLHLAAESHEDRSIEGPPKAMCSALKRSCLAVSGIVIWSNRQETKEIIITTSCRST